MLVTCANCKKPVFVSSAAVAGGEAQVPCNACQTALIVAPSGAVRLVSSSALSPEGSVAPPVVVTSPAPLPPPAAPLPPLGLAPSSLGAPMPPSFSKGAAAVAPLPLPLPIQLTPVAVAAPFAMTPAPVAPVAPAYVEPAPVAPAYVEAAPVFTPVAPVFVEAAPVFAPLAPAYVEATPVPPEPLAPEPVEATPELVEATLVEAPVLLTHASVAAPAQGVVSGSNSWGGGVAQPAPVASGAPAASWQVEPRWAPAPLADAPPEPQAMEADASSWQTPTDPAMSQTATVLIDKTRHDEDSTDELSDRELDAVGRRRRSGLPRVAAVAVLLATGGALWAAGVIPGLPRWRGSLTQSPTPTVGSPPRSVGATADAVPAPDEASRAVEPVAANDESDDADAAVAKEEPGRDRGTSRRRESSRARAARPSRSSRAAKPTRVATPARAPVATTSSARVQAPPPPPPPPTAGSSASGAGSSAAEQHYAQGNLYLKEKKVALAIDELKKTIAIDSRHGLAYRSLGVSYMLLGREKSAIEAYEKFVQYAGSHKDASKVRDIIEGYYARHPR